MCKNEIIKKIISILQKYKVSGIYIFGSLVDGNFAMNSDVDIAVLNLPASEYFNALAELTEELGRPVDLIRLEKVSIPMREHIEEIGEKIAA